MEFICSVVINKPVEEVAAIFANPDNLKHWQDGFVSIEPINGSPGEVGSKARVTLRNKGREIILTETIQVKNMPHEMSALYEHEHMVNTMTNRFTALPDNKTRYDAEINFTKFIGFVPRMMSLLFPGMFKKQTQKVVDKFKVFAEG